ncbi:MAG: hypothetical protein ACR2Q4_04355 [Geminicoccaceae bacterium]
MSKHRFPIILDDRHSDRVQLVTGTETVGLNITANIAEMRVKASTRCFLI